MEYIIFWNGLGVACLAGLIGFGKLYIRSVTGASGIAKFVIIVSGLVNSLLGFGAARFCFAQLALDEATADPSSAIINVLFVLGITALVLFVLGFALDRGTQGKMPLKATFSVGGLLTCLLIFLPIFSRWMQGQFT